MRRGVHVSGDQGAIDWWKHAVIYQIYVRSFADSSGDGTGDLAGITDRMGYLELLGVDALWLTPFYRSPMIDNGYDVADPRDVDPLFGDMDAFDALIADAHRHGIKVTIDLVPNHTSDQHEWFQAALAAPPGDPLRERYIFSDGKGPTGDEPPNNWESAFGGPAWTRVDDGQWYLHLFAPEQPDLNWQHPEVRDDFEATMRFWLDRGVDGFRIDVAHGMAKPSEGLPDMDRRALEALGSGKYFDPRWDNDGVHDIHRFFRSILDDYPGRIATGEVWLFDDARFAQYVKPDELHLAFNFLLLFTAFDARAVRAAIDRSLATVSDAGAPPTWALGNHDVYRQVSRYGGGTKGLARARAMALVTLALPGVVYVYNGDELGLSNVDVPREIDTDPRAQHGDFSRSVARAPIPWEGTRPPFGFSTGRRSWLPMPRDWAPMTVQAQLEDPSSTLSLYRAAIDLRRKLGASGDEISWYDSPDGCCAFHRTPASGADGRRWACVLNTSTVDVQLPDGDIVLASAEVTAGKLRPDAAAWVIVDD